MSYGKSQVKVMGWQQANNRAGIWQPPASSQLLLPIRRPIRSKMGLKAASNMDWGQKWQSQYKTHQRSNTQKK